MNDDGSENLILEIQGLAVDIMAMSEEKPNNFNNLVKEYYEILKDVATDIGLTADNGVSTADTNNVKTLTDQIVSKLKETSVNAVSKENVEKLYKFFNDYKSTLFDKKDGIINYNNDPSKKTIGNNTIPERRPQINLGASGGKRRITKRKRKVNKNNNKRKTKKH